MNLHPPPFDPKPPNMDCKTRNPRTAGHKLITSSSSPGFIKKYKPLAADDDVRTPISSARRGIGRNKSCATYNLSNISTKNPQNSHPLDFYIQEDSPEAEEIADMLISDRIPEASYPHVIKLAISNLEYRRSVFQETGEVRKALAVEKAIHKARDLLIEASKSEFQNATLFDIALRECHANTDYQIFKHKAEMRSEDIEYRSEDLMEQMKKEHQKELKNHADKWESNAMKRKYNKISPKLRELITMRTKLINAKQFDEADKIQNEIEFQEKIELQQNINKRQQDFISSQKRLLEKQKQELENLIMTNQHKKVIFEKSIERQSVPFKKLQKTLEYHHEIANNKNKLWKTKRTKSSEMFYNDAPTGTFTKYADNPTKVLKLPPLKDLIESRK